MQNGKRLIILDLDHTLIYSTDIQLNNSELLLNYSAYLNIYERPRAREMIDLCKRNSDIIVFTTAVEDYAKKVCDKLEINYQELRSRQDCKIKDDKYVKFVDENWLKKYTEIIIIDDSPEIWDSKSSINCKFLVPEKFTGSASDNDFKKVISGLVKIISD